MGDETIRVRAKVRLLTTEEGGKTKPIKGNYRPNHNFFDPDNRNMTIGFIDLTDGKELHPGESTELTIDFLKWPGIESEIYAGREWRIQEGPKLVGIGTVLEVLPSRF